MVSLSLNCTITKIPHKLRLMAALDNQNNIMANIKEKWSRIVELDKKGSVSLLIEELEKFVKEYPNSKSGWLWLGMELTNIARYSDARVAIDRAIRLSKPVSKSIPYMHKGSLYFEIGELKKSELWYRKSIASDPKNGDAWIFLGALLAKSGKYVEAKEAQRKAIKLNNAATDEAHLNLALVLRAEKRYKSALNHIEKALKIDPKYHAAKVVRKDLLEVIR